MLGHPAFLPALIGSDAQCKTLFAQQNVSAVAGIDGDNGVVLREVADITLFRIDIALAMQRANPVIAITQNIEHLLANAGHDRHVQNNINRISDLDADLGNRGTDRSHGERNDIHRAAVIGTAGDVIQLLVHFLRFAPVVGRTGILFFS